MFHTSSQSLVALVLLGPLYSNASWMEGELEYASTRGERVATGGVAHTARSWVERVNVYCATLQCLLGCVACTHPSHADAFQKGTA